MKFHCSILALSLWGTLCANNIAVTNVALTGKNATDSYTLVEFDLSWGKFLAHQQRSSQLGCRMGFC